MAHFAKINENNIVEQVIVVDNRELLVDGIETESKGIEFCQSLFEGNWKQTSYNGTIRKNYAGLDYVYDAARDAFIPPKPFNSWVLDEETCLWKSPAPYPVDENSYTWDEDTTSWVLVVEE